MVVTLSVLAGGFAALSGCGGGTNSSGGGGSGEPSLTARIDAAMKRSDPAMKARDLVPLALSQQKGGDLNGAEKTMRVAAEAARSVPEVDKRAARLNSVAAGFGQISLPDEVKKLLKEVRESIDAIHEKPERIGPLAELGANYGLYGNSQASAEAALREAEEIARAIDMPLEQIRALLKVAYGWSRLKNEENTNRLMGDATELANGLEDARHKTEALADLGRTWHRMQKPTEGDQQFASAAAAATAIEEPASQAYALLYLADKRLISLQNGEAQKLVDKADELSRGIKDGSIRGQLATELDAMRRRL